jgi:hypothetical protein
MSRVRRWPLRILASAFAAGVVARLVLKSRGDEDSDEFDLVTIMGGRALRSRSESFLGGNCLTVFGGLDLDLRRANLGPTGADLDLVIVCGGNRLSVPEDWRVTVSSRSIAAGIDAPVSPDDAEAPHLRIRALVVGGGLQVAAWPRLQVVPA